MAQAQPLTPDALPAVTEPSGFHHAFQLGQRFRIVVWGRGMCTSVENTFGSPFFRGNVTATISRSKNPAAFAFVQRCWLLNASAS